MSSPIRRALISVSDKTGLDVFAGALNLRGVEIVSTGGTARALQAMGVAVTDISAVTGFPEILDGRVKTLHPKVHGGLLGIRGNAGHAQAMHAHGIAPFDLLAVNLYPFEETVAEGADWDRAIETIDIGGPAMIRAAAKNHAEVTVIVSPGDYAETAAEIAATGTTTPDLRRRLAAQAFARTAAYDAAISRWFAARIDEPFAHHIAFGGKRIQSLRYGENPHQAAAFYAGDERRPGVATARQVQGKELSYNNIADSDAAFECVAEFAEPACVIVKHANPCGAAIAATLADAHAKALRCDPVSAYGGIVAVNRELDAETARAIAALFTEVVVAPAASDEALAILAAKMNLRLLLTGGLPDPQAPGLQVKSVAGGLLVQARDGGAVAEADLKVVTRRAPTAAEMADLRFAFRIVKHVKSNAIVYAKDGATVGIGAGQMSRVDSARIAARKAEDAARAQGLDRPPTKGSVVASDAFFPFADGLLQAAEAGATAVIQPGGSLRDADVIEAADTAGLAMVFTGLRHFRH